MNTDNIAYREIAWDRVRFLCPEQWQINKIGHGYLMLEAGSMPVAEIKWRRVKGNFSHKVHLRRLAALNRKDAGKTLTSCPVPGSWQKGLEDFQATGFSWQARAIGAKGVMLFCPACRNATLIQFYERNIPQLDRICSRFLASFQDHSPEGQTIWSVFDIRAVVPEKYQRIGHRFNPGEFELSFLNQQEKLFLYRWGPASILLKNSTLAQFSERTLPIPNARWSGEPGAENDRVACEAAPAGSYWTRLGCRMRAKSSFYWARVWHLAGKNRILGVRAESRTLLNVPDLEKICSGYESL
ncbi:MAG: hypothetical protein Q8P24_05500 [Desulfobacterales bacterium]|nr:hypothetical protein [Desulfobacterales bacterium]